MNIGNVEFENNVFLAPMAGVTDMPFRVLCREQGCGLVYTEMASAKGMYYNSQKSYEIIKICDDEKPAAIQLFGSEPKIMANVADKLNESDACIIDINAGCPTPKIVNNGEGSALMRNPELLGKIVSEVVRASSKPVTVKIRKGWDDANVNAVEVAKIVEAAGASAIAVHGRTRVQFYSGKADWDIIKKVKSAVNIPVIGNGDIFTPQDAECMLKETGCDAVMIGRGSQGNPWIFKRVVEFLSSKKVLDEPSNKEKAEMIIRHTKMMVALKGEKVGIREMRKHIAWYIKGIKNASKLKEKVFKAQTYQEVFELANEYLLL